MRLRENGEVSVTERVVSGCRGGRLRPCPLLRFSSGAIVRLNEHREPELRSLIRSLSFEKARDSIPPVYIIGVVQMISARGYSSHAPFISASLLRGNDAKRYPGSQFQLAKSMPVYLHPACEAPYLEGVFQRKLRSRSVQNHKP